MYILMHHLTRSYRAQNLVFGEELCNRYCRFGFTLRNKEGDFNHYRPKAQCNGKSFDLLSYLGIHGKSVDMVKAHIEFHKALVDQRLTIVRYWKQGDAKCVFHF